MPIRSGAAARTRAITAADGLDLGACAACAAEWPSRRATAARNAGPSAADRPFGIGVDLEKQHMHRDASLPGPAWALAALLSKSGIPARGPAPPARLASPGAAAYAGAESGGRHEHPHPRRRRARTQPGLGGEAEPEMRPADRGAGQCRDRRDRRMRRSRHPRRRRGGRPSPRRTPSISSSSAPRRRSPPGSPTGCARPGSPPSAPRPRRRGWKPRRRFAKEICEAARGAAGGLGAVRRGRRRRRTYPRARARRSWSRPTGWPPARAWWWRWTWPRPLAAVDDDVRRRLRRGRGRGGDRGIHGGRRGQLLRALRRHRRAADRHRPGPQARLRRRRGARIPAAWAPIRRRRC